MTNLKKLHPSEWNSFRKAKSRCTCATDSTFRWYGAKGIEFRFESFRAFLNVLGSKPEGCSLERIDPKGHYEPGNVCWDLRSRENRNKTNSKFITYNGKTQCLADWADELNIPYMRLWKRLYHLNWSFERAIA